MAEVSSGKVKLKQVTQFDPEASVPNGTSVTMYGMPVVVYDTDASYIDASASWTDGYIDSLEDWEQELMSEHRSKVEVEIEFNRPLTWSEREAFRVALDKKLEKVEDHPTHVTNFKYNFKKKNFARVFFSFEVSHPTAKETRWLTDVVAAVVSKELLNVHPKAAKTISPKVVV